MYTFFYSLHNSNGDRMDIDIRKNVIDKIKDDDEKTIVETINEAVVNGDELVLPGLGVMVELFWNELSLDEKNKIAGIIKRKIK